MNARSKVEGYAPRLLGRRLNWVRLPAVRLLVALAVGYGAYLAVAAGSTALFWLGYNALMAYWGVTARNAAYAPEWIHALAGAAPSLLAVLQNALAMLALWGLWLAFERRTGDAKERAGAVGVAPSQSQDRRGVTGASCRGGTGVMEWGMGVLTAVLWIAVAAALLLLTDTSRLGWRLNAPQFSWITAALLPAALFAAMGEELFARGYVMGMATRRAGRTIGYALSIVATLAVHAAEWRSPMALINVALMGLLCARLYDVSGRIWVGVGFRFGWTYLAQAVAGFPGSKGAVYEIYAASRDWLSGGDAGLMQGVLAALLFALTLAALWKFPLRYRDR